MASAAKLGRPDASDNYTDPEGGLTPKGKALNILARGMRPEGMTYKSYKDLVGMEKGEEGVLSQDAFKALPVEGSEGDESDNESEASDEDEDEDEDTEEEDDDMEKKKAKKSMSVSDLLKSVDAYDAVEEALAESGTSRESYLQAKLDSGTISKSERQELGSIWSGDNSEDGEGEVLSKSVTSHVEDEGNAELIDASDFLKSLVGGIDQRMDKVETEVIRDGRATRELMKAQGALLKGLAGVIAEQDEIIKSLNERVETVETTPAQRRSVSTQSGAVVSRGLAKSAIGETNVGGDMTKSQIKGGLRSLMVHASESQDDAAMDRITHATALFEQTGALPNNMMQAIQQVAAS